MSSYHLTTDNSDIRKNTVTKAASEVLSSENPGKWVAGIAIGAIAVAGMAIKAIHVLDNGKR